MSARAKRLARDAPFVKSRGVWIGRRIWSACVDTLSSPKTDVLVCWFVFCTVTDFSGENKASGVKFCTVVQGRTLGQGISHFEELQQQTNRTNRRAISSSSSKRQICKASLHTKVSQTRLLQYAHSSSQLFRLRLNYSRVLALRMFEGRPFQVEGPAIRLSLIHIWRCRRSTLCRSRWSPYH